MSRSYHIFFQTDLTADQASLALEELLATPRRRLDDPEFDWFCIFSAMGLKVFYAPSHQYDDCPGIPFEDFGHVLDIAVLDRNLARAASDTLQEAYALVLALLIHRRLKWHLILVEDVEELIIRLG